MAAPRKTTRVDVRVPAPLVTRLDQLAAASNLTRSGALLLSASAGIEDATRTVTHRTQEAAA